MYRFESCPDYESQEPLGVSTLVDSSERRAIQSGGGMVDARSE
jgi:hypothetical protein